MYAASIYKCAFSDHTHRYIEPTQQEMDGNEHTTTRRFQIRPVTIIVAPFLSYEEILKAIRDEMCHGFGCKGPRTSTNIDCESVVSSENSFISNVSDEHFDGDYSPEDDVDIEALEHKKVRKIRYISTTTNENFNGKRCPIIREYFIAFKADKHTGDLIYGAAISRRYEHDGPMDDKELVKDHYKTAIARLEKKPVPMRISEEYRHQLKSKVSHREDIMYEILDVINSRPGGRFLIKEVW